MLSALLTENISFNFPFINSVSYGYCKKPTPKQHLCVSDVTGVLFKYISTFVYLL